MNFLFSLLIRSVWWQEKHVYIKVNWILQTDRCEVFCDYSKSLLALKDYVLDTYSL